MFILEPLLMATLQVVCGCSIMFGVFLILYSLLYFQKFREWLMEEWHPSLPSLKHSELFLELLLMALIVAVICMAKIFKITRAEFMIFSALVIGIWIWFLVAIETVIQKGEHEHV